MITDKTYTVELTKDEILTLSNVLYENIEMGCSIFTARCLMSVYDKISEIKF